MTVIGDNDAMVRASMDADCNVNLDAHTPLGVPGLSAKLTVHQGKNELLQGTAVYGGAIPRTSGLSKTRVESDTGDSRGERNERKS